jgi:hypothetical protein
MKPPLKTSVLFLLVGVVIGALLMRAVTPIAAYRSVITNLHFLIREGDAASAAAAFESCVSYGGNSYLSHSELIELDQALRQASIKHVE